MKLLHQVIPRLQHLNQTQYQQVDADPENQNPGEAEQEAEVEPGPKAEINYKGINVQ